MQTQTLFAILLIEMRGALSLINRKDVFMVRETDYLYLVRKLLKPYGIKVWVMPLGDLCLYDRDNSSFTISRSDFFDLDLLRAFVRLNFTRDFDL